MITRFCFINCRQHSPTLSWRTLTSSVNKDKTFLFAVNMCPDSVYSAHSIHYRIPESSGDEIDESEEEDAAAATAAGLLGKAI